MSTMNVSANGGKPFSSLASLTEAHTKLLKACKGEEAGPVLDEIDAFIKRASATGALLDNDNDRYASQSMLDYWMTVLYRANRTPPDGALAEFDPSLSPKLDDALCPYRGLNAFQEEDKELYYTHAFNQSVARKTKNHQTALSGGPVGKRQIFSRSGRFNPDLKGQWH